MFLSKNCFIYIFCNFFIYLKIEFVLSSCEKNALPDSIEVTNNDDIILKCSKPNSSVIQKNRYQFFNNETWHLYSLNFKLCAFNYSSNKCDGRNGEWISNINSSNTKSVNFTCCQNDEFKSSKFLKYFYIEKGQKVKVGEITKNGKLNGFAYISNLMKVVNYDKSVTYKISVNAISYQKPKLQMHGITTNIEKPMGDSKKTSELNPLNDEEDLNAIEFGVCSDDNKNKTEKPCSIMPTNYHRLPTTNKRLFSQKLYQAPLRPGSSQFIPSKATNELSPQNSNDASETIEDDDFSVEFGGSDQCPFDGDTDGFEEEDGIAKTTGNQAANTDASANANNNANGNIDANSQTNTNQNSQTDTNQNSQINNNQNPQINQNLQSNVNQNSQMNQNSQIDSSQNSQANTNQNSQSNINQNSQINTNQNSQTNINQNLQNNIDQTSLLQSQNINPQIVQSQNPINSFAQMPLPNVPFVQNPVYPQPAAADYGVNGNAGFAQAAGASACFTGDTEVQTLNGEMKRMDELEVDDWIYSAGDVKFGFSRVISWLHRMPKLKFEFIKITLENGKSLKITKNHYIYKSDCYANETIQTIPKQLIEAQNIQIHDCLLHLNNTNQLEPIQVIKIESIFEEGIYAPLTESGNIFVNGILASCYSEIDSHSLLSILPRLYKYFTYAAKLFQVVFFEFYSKMKEDQNEIDLIPGIEKLIEVIKSDLYPNYQKM